MASGGDASVPKVLVGFGSQTGCGQSIAAQLFADLRTHVGTHNQSLIQLSELNSWRTKLDAFAQIQHVIIVCSTTGAGDAPDNADRFWRAIRKRTMKAGTFTGLHFSVLALGDTNYDHFCQAGKRLHKRLKDLGATCFHDLTLADDAVGIEDKVEPWCAAMIAAMKDAYAAGPASSGPGAGVGASASASASASTSAKAAAGVGAVASGGGGDDHAGAPVVNGSAEERAGESAPRADAATASGGPVRNDADASGSATLAQATTNDATSRLAPDGTGIGSQVSPPRGGGWDGAARDAIVAPANEAVGGEGDWHSSSAQQSLRALTLLGRGGTVYFNEVNILNNATKTQQGARAYSPSSSSSRDGAVATPEPPRPALLPQAGPSAAPSSRSVTAAAPTTGCAASSSPSALGSSARSPNAFSAPDSRGGSDAETAAHGTVELTRGSQRIRTGRMDATTEAGAKNLQKSARPTPFPAAAAAGAQALVARGCDATQGAVVVAAAPVPASPASADGANTTPDSSALAPVGLAQLFPDMFSDPDILKRMMAQVRPPRLRPAKHKLRVHPDSSRVMSKRDSVRRLAKARPARTLPPGTLGATVVDAKELTNRTESARGAGGASSAGGGSESVAGDGDFGGRTVLLLRLKLHQNFQWSCGDAFGVYCENDSAEVEALLTRLRVQRDLWDSESLDFKPKLPHVFPSTSLRTLLTFCCALRWIFQKSFLRTLAEFCSDTFEKNQLLLLSSATGRVYFDALVLRQQPSVLELLQLFPSCVPPVSVVLSHSAPLSPRYYSVANSPLVLEEPTGVPATGAGEGSVASPALEPLVTGTVIGAAGAAPVPLSAQGQPRSSSSSATAMAVRSSTAKSTTSTATTASSSAGGGVPAAGSQEVVQANSGDKSTGNDTGDATAASSSGAHSRIIEVVFSVVRYTIGSRKHPVRRSGLCTTWLEAIAQPFFRQDRSFQSREITLVHRPAGDFRPPDDVERPLIMVGPGTGVAPFVGFLKHREAQKAISEQVRHDEACEGHWRVDFSCATGEIGDEEADFARTQKTFGETHLFFGCRHRDQDFLFRDELARLERQGALTTLYTAFSRETASKVYVTHRLRQNAATVARLIREGLAVIYVCGDGTHMAKDVEAVILDILANTHSSDAGDSSGEDSPSQTPHMSHRQRAVAELELLKGRKRYLQDIWS